MEASKASFVAVIVSSASELTLFRLYSCSWEYSYRPAVGGDAIILPSLILLPSSTSSVSLMMGAFNLSEESEREREGGREGEREREKEKEKEKEKEEEKEEEKEKERE